MHSLKSILKIYDNGIDILKVYLFGGKTFGSLHDSHGGRLLVEVSKDNVERVISLSNVLYGLRDKYEVTSSEIKCEPCPNIIVSIGRDFTAKELHLLNMHYSLGKYVVDNVRFDDDHYLATDIEGLKWILRKVTLMEDAIFGLLLPYITEPEEHEWFLKALRKGGVFVDVGANVGGYTVRACKEGVETIAIELDPDNCRVLKLNLQLNQCTNAMVLNMAAGSRREVRKRYFGRENSPARYSLLQDKHAKEVKCSIKVQPLDTAVTPLLGDKWVNLLKIDVEGFEVEVIKGALNLLKRTRNVIVEVILSTGSKMKEVLELLRPMGFKLVDKVCRQSLYCDLFLRRRI